MQADLAEAETWLQVGQRLRGLRAERGFTIGQLAGRAGVSSGIISQIERGLANPSMRTLGRLGQGLGITLAALLDPAPAVQEPGFVRRAATRMPFTVGRGGMTQELLTPWAENPLRLLMLVMPPGSETVEVTTGPGQKAGLVLEGLVELLVAGSQARLAAGDAFQFDSSLAHGLRNPGREAARLLWVLSMPPGQP